MLTMNTTFLKEKQPDGMDQQTESSQANVHLPYTMVWIMRRYLMLNII